MRFEHWVYTIPLRLRSLFRRNHLSADLDEELRDHIDRQIEDNLARGMSPEEVITATDSLRFLNEWGRRINSTVPVASDARNQRETAPIRPPGRSVFTICAVIRHRGGQKIGNVLTLKNLYFRPEIRP